MATLTLQTSDFSIGAGRKTQVAKTAKKES